MANGNQVPPWMKELWKELTTPPGFLNLNHLQKSPYAKEKQRTENAGKKNKTRERRNDDQTSENEDEDEDLEEEELDYEEEEELENTSKGQKSLEDIRIILRANGFNPRLTEQYPFEIYKAIPFQSVMQLQTSDGNIVLKRAHVKRNQLQFMAQALQFVEIRGFTRFAKLIPTLKNLLYSPVGDEIFYATQWIDGYPVDMTSMQQVEQAAFSIAEFHRASRGFESQGYHRTDSFQISKTMQTRSKELNSLLSKIKSKRKLDPADRFIIKHLPRYKKQAEQAIAYLADSRCKQFLLLDEQNPGLCHLDITPQNMVFSPRNGVYLIDFDLMSYGPRMLDIGHLIRRSLQMNDWRRESALVPLVQANRVEPLRHAEYLILQSLLTFPHSFWRTVHNHYTMRSTPYTLARLEQLYEQEEDRQVFLKDLSEHVARHRGN